MYELLSGGLCVSHRTEPTISDLWRDQTASRPAARNLRPDVAGLDRAEGGGAALHGLGPGAVRKSLWLRRPAVPLGRGPPLPAPRRARRPLLPPLRHRARRRRL